MRCREHVSLKNNSLHSSVRSDLWESGLILHEAPVNDLSISDSYRRSRRRNDKIPADLSIQVWFVDFCSRKRCDGGHLGRL